MITRSKELGHKKANKNVTEIGNNLHLFWINELVTKK